MFFIPLVLQQVWRVRDSARTKERVVNGGQKILEKGFCNRYAKLKLTMVEEIRSGNHYFEGHVPST